jgi:cytosine/adenosine deaminase-related metal-dependent hydrolase
MLMLFLAALIAAACEGAEAFVVPGHSPMRLRAALAGRMGRGPPIFHDRIALSRFHGSVARGRRAPSAAGRTEGLRMGGYEVSSATSMGTEYTFLAAKCFVDGAVQPAEVKVENERIAYVCVLTEGEYKAALQAAPKSVLPIGPEILLLPALVNAHTHLAMGALRGVTDGDAFTGNVVEDLFFRLEVALQPDDVRAFVRMGCWEAMLAGTGCVWEHYYFGDAIADAFLDTGMTGAIAPTLQDLSGPGLVLPGCGAEDSMRTTMAIHRNETLRSKGVVAALGPHATDTVSPQVCRC